MRNLSPGLWGIRHLTALFLNGNHLTRIPPEISQLSNLTMLDLSHNKLRSLPTELGDMISLCHLYLNSNQLRVLPYELGKLFRLQTLGSFRFCLSNHIVCLKVCKVIRYHRRSAKSITKVMVRKSCCNFCSIILQVSRVSSFFLCKIAHRLSFV